MPPTGDSLLKRIEIHNDQVDGRYIVFLHLLLISGIIATCKDATKDLRVQCLDATAQDRRICSHVFHLLAWIAQAFDELLSTTCAKELYSLLMKFSKDILQSILMENGDARISSSPSLWKTEISAVLISFVSAILFRTLKYWMCKVTNF